MHKRKSKKEQGLKKKKKKGMFLQLFGTVIKRVIKFVFYVVLSKGLCM